MKVIEITTHKAIEWTSKDENVLKYFIRSFPGNLHRLHNLAYNAFSDRERGAIRRKLYRLRMEREYIDTVNNVRQELLGV